MSYFMLVCLLGLFGRYMSYFVLFALLFFDLYLKPGGKHSGGKQKQRGSDTVLCGVKLKTGDAAG